MKVEDIRVLLLNPAPSLIKYGMRWGFEKNGCFVHLMEDVYLLTQPNQKSLAAKKIEEAIKKYEINLIFTEGYANMPIYEMKNLCKRYNVKLHWWAIEDPVTPHIAENVARNKLADFIWTTTLEFVNKYKKIGVDADLLLFGCNPDFQKPVACENRFKHDISLVGTNYSNRYDKIKEFIFPLMDKDFDLKIYGLWWMDSNREVNLIGREKFYWQEKGYVQLPYEWLPIVINSSKIMLGINCTDESITQTSCRPYETLCSADSSIYLAYYTEAQERIFGNTIIQAKTSKEMIEKATEILNWSEEERRKFAEKGRRFVAKNHNYRLRAKQVLNKFLEG